MDEIDEGKHVLSAAKSLKAFQLADAKIAAFLHATSFAGRAGLLAAALRHHTGVDAGRLTFLAAEEGLSLPDVDGRVAPWLEESGLCRVNRRSDGQLLSVDSLILTYDSILAAVCRLYRSLTPTPEDLGCIQVLHLVSQVPQPQSEVTHQVALALGEQTAGTSVELTKAYRIVSYREGKGLAEPFLFSERLWAHNVDRAAQALSSLDSTDRALILELVERVRRYQGMPEEILRQHARENNAQHLLRLAVDIGLINRTDIQMADGALRTFLTSPHFYEDLADEFGEDMLDRVKIFLDSIRNGQHFGDAGTGRIRDPDALLSKLLNAGEIGPCTAIGTDYITSEKAGIVRVQRARRGSSQYSLELIQRDTVEKVLEVIRAGRIEGHHASMEAGHVTEGTRFRSIEQYRAEVGKAPGPVDEAERAIILKLREG